MAFVVVDLIFLAAYKLTQLFASSHDYTSVVYVIAHRNKTYRMPSSEGARPLTITPEMYAYVHWLMPRKNQPELILVGRRKKRVQLQKE